MCLLQDQFSSTVPERSSLKDLEMDHNVYLVKIIHISVLKTPKNEIC